MGRRSRSRSPSRSRFLSRSRSPAPTRSPSEENGEEEEEEVTTQGPTSDSGTSKVVFSSTHGVDLQPGTCNVCRHVGWTIKPVVMELVKPRGLGNWSEVPSAAARFCRSDEAKPTLTFSDSSMDLATKIFSLSKFKVLHHFETLI